MFAARLARPRARGPPARPGEQRPKSCPPSGDRPFEVPDFARLRPPTPTPVSSFQPISSSNAPDSLEGRIARESIASFHRLLSGQTTARPPQPPAVAEQHGRSSPTRPAWRHMHEVAGRPCCAGPVQHTGARQQGAEMSRNAPARPATLARGDHCGTAAKPDLWRSLKRPSARPRWFDLVTRALYISCRRAGGVKTSKRQMRSRRGTVIESTNKRVAWEQSERLFPQADLLRSRSAQIVATSRQCALSL